MLSSKQPDVQYISRYCALLGREVEVVLVKQPNSSWQFMKCLGKEKACTGHQCPVSEGSCHQPYDLLWM